MSINLTDEIEVKTKKGKLGAAKQIFLEGDTQTVEKEIQDINSRHNDLSSKHKSLSSTVSEHTKQIESNQSQITANKSAQDEKNTSLDANMAKLNTRDEQITELVKGITATGGASVATAVTYDNTSSQLVSATVQGAVDELQSSKIDKTSISQESGESEDKVMSQKAVSDKLSNLSSGISLDLQSETFFDVSKMTDKTASAQHITGLYKFGQVLNDAPAYTASGSTLKYETADFTGSDKGVYIYLEGCSVANSEYRTYAIYNKDGKLIKEGVNTTGIVFYICQKVTIIATCTKIYEASSDSQALQKNIKTAIYDAKDEINSKLSQTLSISTINDLVLDKTKITTVIGVKQEQGGLYKFRQNVNEEPAIKNNNIPVFKATITFKSSSTPLLVLLDSCKSAAIDYRSYAIYDTEGNIISEQIANGDIALVIKTSCSILASCNGIYSTNYNNYNKKSINSSINDLSNKIQGLSISIINDLVLDKSKITNSIGEQLSQGGLYKFGQAIDEEPAVKLNSGYPVHKAVISVNSSTRPFLVLLENCKTAAIDYRSYAIYDSNNNLIKESVFNGNTYFIVKESCTIIATCDAIKSIPLDSYKKAYVSEELADQNKRIKDLEGIQNVLSGKTIWTLFDSLGHNTWQQHFVDISGTIFYPELNIKSDKPISWGGSNSSPLFDDSTQVRAINLVSYKDDYPIDYVFIENINDRGNNNYGTITDSPFMRSQRLIYRQAGNLTSHNEANSYLQNHKNDIIASMRSNKKIGTIISVPYQNENIICGSKIKFLTRPSAEGDISISMKNQSYSIHVTPSMTTQNIVDEFIKYSYGAGWSDIDNGDGSISIFFYKETDIRATFNGGNTGVTAEVTDTTGGGYVDICYIGKSIDDTDWNNVNNWVDNISLHSIYKGIIEYLQTELPQAKLYWVAPFAEAIDFKLDTYKKLDGTWSQDKFRNSDLYKSHRKLYDVQKSVCEYYNIPFLDLDSVGGMSILNIETFFNTNNVHPKSIGYDRYAETILRMVD